MGQCSFCGQSTPIYQRGDVVQVRDDRNVCHLGIVDHTVSNYTNRIRVLVMGERDSWIVNPRDITRIAVDNVKWWDGTPR